MIFLSLLLFTIGTIFIFFHRKISNWLYKLHYPYFKKMYSWFIDIDGARFRKSYDFAMLFFGLSLLIGAYFVYFGPITL